MWTRKELKQQAIDALQRNYWRIVLVALTLLVLGNNNVLGSTSYSAVGTVGTVPVDETGVPDTGGDTLMDIIGSEISAMDIAITSMDSLIAAAENSVKDLGRAEVIITGVIIFLICMAIVIAMFALMVAFVAFLFNPFAVGAQRFMLKSIDGRAEVKEMAYAFDHSYKNIVKTMFHTQLSVFLWSLLFLIPGLYKKYQYRMVEYILAEYPDIYYKDAMQLSKEMMEGEKWHALVLDLSFILWELVSVMTCGLVHVLFVAPYQYLTNAALYRRLCALRGQQESGRVNSKRRKQKAGMDNEI
jgi:uncharacterized membrane protein